MSEKQYQPLSSGLPSPAASPTYRPGKPRMSIIGACILLPLLPLLAVITDFELPLPDLPSFVHHCSSSTPVYSAVELAQAKCPKQPPALSVGSNWNPLTDDDFAHLAATRLSKAVQIRTESFDDLPMNASDPLFDKHYKFSEFLEAEYPKLFSDPIRHEYINTHGHLFTWKGSNEDLAPILLMAHIDTVPVLGATLDQWTFPPFEGKISVNATNETPGTWIWGRGSSDCKNSLLGIYNAVERLVDEGFKPERTIMIANGFDEEIGGPRGALKIAEKIQERYGEQSIAFLIDEGFSGISQEFGRTFASIGMAEKGSVNVDIKVEAIGGHSSIPPPHTAIGIMSLILAHLEANPFEPILDPRGPYLKYLSCLSDYAPDFPKKIKKAVQNPKQWKKLAKELAVADRKVNSFLATTQAIDLINGGVKVNALPEVVTATVNHRISFTSNVNETIEHVQQTLESFIHSLNFTLSSFDNSPKSSPYHVTLSIPGGGRGERGLEPAPITSAEDPSFAFLAGTTKAVFGDDVIVAPTGMYGQLTGVTGRGWRTNTDTSRFWSLTKNLYRFTPALVTENLYQHTVDERISLNGHLNTTRFYYKLIQNSIGWEP